MSIATESLQMYTPANISPALEGGVDSLLPQQAPTAPNEAYASPRAREIIATNIEGLRVKGDAIGMVRKRGELHWTTKVAGVTTLGTQLIAVASTEDYPNEKTYATSLIAVAAIAASRTYLAYRHEAARERSVGEKILPEISEVVDFWTVGAKRSERDVVMCWSGAKRPEDNEQTPELQSSLKLVADIAKKNRISAVFVPPNVLEAVPAAETIGKKIELRDWAARRKKIDVNAKKADGSRAELTMLAFTPAELQSVSELVKNEEHLSKSVKAYIEVIRRINREHPIVRCYDEAKIVDSNFIETLKRIAQKNIEMRLDDVDMRRSSDPFNPTRERVAVTASYSKGNILWSANGKYDKTQPVNAAVGMTNEEAKEAVEIPEIHGASRVLLAAELLISQVELASSEAPIVRYTPVAENSALHMALHAHRYRKKTQSKTAAGIEFVISQPSRYRRARMLGLAAIMAAALTVPFAHGFVVAQHETNAANIEDAYRLKIFEHEDADQLKVYEQDIESIVLTAKQKTEIEAEIEAQHPYGSLYTKLVETEKNAAQSAIQAVNTAVMSMANAEMVETDGGFSFSGVGGHIGNVPQDKPEQTMWEIQNPSNQPITGYWSQSVSTTLSPYADWVMRGPEHGSNIMDELKNDPEAFSNKESIVVKGTARATFYEKIGFALVPVPVLDGYEVVATNGNGWIVRTSGGGIALGYETGGQQDVRYALLDAGRFTAGRSQLHSTLDPFSIDKNDSRYTELVERVQMSIALEDEWEKAIPGVNDLPNPDKLKAQIDYIKNGFDYKLSPVPEDMQKLLDAGEYNIEDFVAGQLKEQAANCNVAATMVGASNPFATPAVGYLNNSDNTLTDREAHMWLVDRSGNRYDPTPSKLIKESGMNNLLPSFSSDYKSNLPRPEVVAASLLAALALTQRRRVAKSMSRAIVGATSAESLRGSLQVLDTALYAQSVSLSKPAAYLQSKPKEELLERLASPQYHDAATKQHVKASAVTLPRPDKRAVKKARRLLKRVAAIRSIKMSHQDTGINSVL